MPFTTTSPGRPVLIQFSRAGAVVALVVGFLAWIVFAFFVWAVTLLIVAFRHDGIVSSDRTFLAWAPAAAFFVAPVVLTCLSAVVVQWRRPGWFVIVSSFVLGGAVSGVAMATVLWLGWSA